MALPTPLCAPCDLGTRGALAATLAMVALVLVGCTPPGNGSSGRSSGNGSGLPGLTAQLVQAFPSLSFNSLLTMITDPSDASRWFIGERSGLISWVSTAAPAVKNTMGTVPEVSGLGEGGLLGMALHPNFPSPADLFVSYTIQGATYPSEPNPLDSRISRIDITGDTLGGPQVLLQLEQPYSNHNGGHIAFGPDDGYLYIAFGDGGSGGDPQGNGQDLTTLLGKLLRIDVGGGPPYEVPPENPFVGGSAGELGEIYAYGLRNPWRFSFDRDTGELWLADVGQGAWEEIDIVGSGDNLGWNIMEGAHCYNDGSCNPGDFTLPVAEYMHAAGNCSITGGYVYRGTAYAAWQGLYFYGDYCSGRIWTVPAAGGAPVEMVDTALNIAGFAEDAAGELYVLTSTTGDIYHLVPTP